MATITKRVKDLESKTIGQGNVLLTIIRKILHANAPEGGTWVARFDPKHSPTKLAGTELLSHPGESEEQFRARVQALADKQRKKGAPVRIFLSSADVKL